MAAVENPARAALELHATGAEANAAAIRAVQRCIENHPGIDADLREYINTRLPGWCGSLYRDNLAARGPIIQIDGEFTKTHPKKSIKVNVTFDVDIPLVTSPQMPHIGWELQVDDVKVRRDQNTAGPDRATRLRRQDDSGHSYVAEGVLRVGRPAAGARKVLAKTAAGGGDNAPDDMFKFHVSYYKIPDDKDM